MAKSSRSQKTSKRSSSAPASRQESDSPTLNRIIFLVALFGVLLTVHFWVQAERGFDRGCLGLSDPATAGEVGCSAVISSGAGQMLGVSNIAWGFLFYVGVAALAFATIFAEGRRALLRRISFGATIVGFLISAYLTIYQLTMLDDVCVLCLISAGTVTALLAVHLAEFIRRQVPAFDASGVVREMGLFALATFVAGAFIVGDLLFVNGLGTRDASDERVREIVQQTVPELIDPQYLAQMAPCSFSDDPPPLADLDQFIFEEDEFRGSPDAPVRVIDFFDPNCPHCKTLHETMKPVIAANRDKARFYYRPFPIWSFSNRQVQALYLARDQDKFLEMMEQQFERQQQGGLSREQLEEIARDIGLDMDQFTADLVGGKHMAEIQQERLMIAQAGITSFPKVAIDGQFVSSTRQAMTSDCFNFLIDQEYRAAASGD